MTSIDAPYLFLTLVLLLGVVGTGVADPAQETTPLSLHEAIQQALAHDPVVQLATLNLEIAQIDYDRLRSAGIVGGTRSSHTRIESDLKSAKLAYVRDVNDAIVSIIDDALALKVAVLRTRARMDQLSSKQQTLNLIVSREASGAADKLDELSARAELNAAQSELSAAQLSTQQAEQRLRHRLGLPADRPVAVGDLPEFRMYSPPDDSLGRVRKGDSDMVQKQAAASLAQIELDKAHASAAAPLDVHEAEIELAVAKAQLAKAEDDLGTSLQNAIAAVQRTADDYHTATMSLQLARQRHDIIRQQNGTGQRTDLDVLNDTVALEESQASQLDALRSNWKALMTLEVLIGTDLRPARGEVPAE
jgi:outer membrane protein TolC